MEGKWRKGPALPRDLKEKKSRMWFSSFQLHGAAGTLGTKEASLIGLGKMHLFYSRLKRERGTTNPAWESVPM